MTEYSAITVILFKKLRGKYYFYLVKRGENLPIMPSSWTSIAGLITEKDHRICEQIQQKYGEMCENMLNHFVVVRLLLERNLLPMNFKNSYISSKDQVYNNIQNMDPALMNVLCHSMIPAGTTRMTDGQNFFNVKFVLLIP